jgi:hypothetical protein
VIQHSVPTSDRRPRAARVPGEIGEQTARSTRVPQRLTYFSSIRRAGQPTNRAAHLVSACPSVQRGAALCGVLFRSVQKASMRVSLEGTSHQSCPYRHFSHPKNPAFGHAAERLRHPGSFPAAETRSPSHLVLNWCIVASKDRFAISMSGSRRNVSERISTPQGPL